MGRGIAGSGPGSAMLAAGGASMMTSATEITIGGKLGLGLGMRSGESLDVGSTGLGLGLGS